jgi:hypothetical protein
VVHGPALRRPGGDRDDGVDDEVDRDHVEHALGDAGELRQRAPAEGQDHRLGHAEALDPAGDRARQGALDDRGPDDGERVVPGRLVERHLGERLREGVDVRPAEAARPGPPVLDEAVALPVAPVLLGALGDRLGPGTADLVPGLGLEALQQLGAAGVGLDLGPRPGGGVRLGAPPDPAGEQLLGLGAPGEPGDVGGRDVQERLAPTRLVELERAEQVGLEGLVDRRVERHRRRRMDDEVDVVGDWDRPADQVGRERAGLGRRQLAQGLEAHPVDGGLERRAGQHGTQPGGGVPADQQVDALDRRVDQEPLEQRGAEEAGGAGHEDPLACQPFPDHAPVAPLRRLRPRGHPGDCRRRAGGRGRKGSGPESAPWARRHGRRTRGAALSTGR